MFGQPRASNVMQCPLGQDLGGSARFGRTIPKAGVNPVSDHVAAARERGSGPGTHSLSTLCSRLIGPDPGIEVRDVGRP